MKGVTIWVTIAFALVLILGTGAGASTAFVVHVPHDYPDIYLAIQNAPDGALIKVSGVQNITQPILVGRPVTIMGGVYRAADPFDAPKFFFGLFGPGVRLYNVTIDAMDIPGPSRSIGIYVYTKTKVSIENVVIRMPLLDTANLFDRAGLKYNIGIWVAGGNASIRFADIHSEIDVVVTESLNNIFFGGGGRGKASTVVTQRTLENINPGERNDTALEPVQGDIIRVNPSVGINPIYAYIYGSTLRGDIAIGALSYISSPVVISHNNVIEAETPYLAYMRPYFPTDMPLNTLFFLAEGDVSTYWEGGDALDIPLATLLYLLAGARTNVTLHKIDMYGYQAAVYGSVGAYIGRAGYGGAVYLTLKDVTGHLDLSDSFIELYQVPGVLYLTVEDVEAYSPEGNEFIRIEALASRASLNLLVEDSMSEGFIDGIKIIGRVAGFESVWIRGERYFHGVRDGYGLYIDALIKRPENPFGGSEEFAKWVKSKDAVGLMDKDDILFKYSILWNVFIRAVEVKDPSQFIGVSLYETVYYEGKSTYLSGGWINSIWTLQTLVLSSILGTPLEGAVVTYTSSSFKSSGLTDPSGRYRYMLMYRLDPTVTKEPYVFRPRDSMLWRLIVEGELEGASDREIYVPYVGDIHTLPSWYGEIILQLWAIAIRVVGFSHDMGTTMLMIRGYFGGFAGFYSDKPDAAEGGAPIILDPNRASKDGEQPGYKFYSMRITNIQVSGSLVTIKAIVFYEDFWHPTTIYIERMSGLVWSPGPVDFRGWLVTG